MRGHCAVIGGNGFIGSVLVSYLLAMGKTVTVIDLHPPLKAIQHTAVNYLVGDYGNRGFIDIALNGVDEIVHLAHSGPPMTSFTDTLSGMKANVSKSVALFESASSHPVKKILFISSGGTVYGKMHKKIIKEDHPTNPISPYGITKLIIEKYAFMYYAMKKLPVICVRPSNAYGETQKHDAGQGFIAVAINKLLQNEQVDVYGRVGTIRDYIHVDDLASAISSVLDRGKIGSVYNIGTGVGKNNLQVLEEILIHARPYGLNFNIRTMPERHYDVPSNILDYSSVRRDTGWSPNISFSDGISQVWSWHANRYHYFGNSG